MLLVVPLAGCLGDASDLPLAPEGPRFILDDPAELPPPSLAEPPIYVRGQWWTYEANIELGDLDDEITVVAASATEEHQLIGMPADRFSDLALLNHFPVQGEVDRNTLGIDMHGQFLPLLKFPLEDGKTWKAPVVTEATATVTVHDEHTAEVVFVGGLLPIRLVYDARIGAITEYEVPGLCSAKLIDHGFGHTGDVVVATDFWLNMWGSAVGAVSLGPAPLTQTGAGLEAGAPIEQAEIPDRDAASYFVYVGNFDVLPVNTPGTYIEHTVLPDGTEHTLTRSPADGVGGTGLIGRSEAPGGTWSFQHAAIGAGVALTEVAAYDQVIYTL